MKEKLLFQGIFRQKTFFPVLMIRVGKEAFEYFQALPASHMRYDGYPTVGV